MEVNFDADAKVSPNENNTATEKKGNNNNSTKEQMKNKKDNETSQSNENFNSIIKYFIFGLVLVLIVCLIVFMCYKSFKTQNNNLGALLETARKEEAILSGKVKSLEQEKQMYVQKLNQLNAELQMQQSAPYSSTLPMTKNSYEAPDPNKPKENPTLLKDKEAIKAYVNNKRQTVQDEIDEREAEEREIQHNINSATKEEIQKQTHSEKRGDDNYDNYDNVNNADNNTDDEDADKVGEIMSIIQPQ